MRDTLRQPKWIVASVLVVLIAAVFVRLGLWQLDRLQERQAENALGLARIEEEPVPFDQLLDQADGDFESIEYRRTTVSGVWDPTEEVLIRSQVEAGMAGFHVVTPLLVDGGGVLVNRGWVPLTMDSPPVVDAGPGLDGREVEGWVHLTQTRPSLGAVEPPGRLPVLNRIDIERIGSQTSYPLAPVYLVEIAQNDGLPIPVDPPDFSYEGNHLSYALQWFGFALIGLVGFYFLLRRQQPADTKRR